MTDIEKKAEMENARAAEDIKLNRLSKRSIKKMIKGYLIWFGILLVLLLSFMFIMYLTGQQEDTYGEGLIWISTLWH